MPRSEHRKSIELPRELHEQLVIEAAKRRMTTASAAADAVETWIGAKRSTTMAQQYIVTMRKSHGGYEAIQGQVEAEGHTDWRTTATYLYNKHFANGGKGVKHGRRPVYRPALVNDMGRQEDGVSGTYHVQFGIPHAGATSLDETMIVHVELLEKEADHE